MRGSKKEGGVERVRIEWNWKPKKKWQTKSNKQEMKGKKKVHERRKEWIRGERWKHKIVMKGPFFFRNEIVLQNFILFINVKSNTILQLRRKSKFLYAILDLCTNPSLTLLLRLLPLPSSGYSFPLIVPSVCSFCRLMESGMPRRRARHLLLFCIRISFYLVIFFFGCFGHKVIKLCCWNIENRRDGVRQAHT